MLFADYNFRNKQSMTESRSNITIHIEIERQTILFNNGENANQFDKPTAFTYNRQRGDRYVWSISEEIVFQSTFSCNLL